MFINIAIYVASACMFKFENCAFYYCLPEIVINFKLLMVFTSSIVISAALNNIMHINDVIKTFILDVSLLFLFYSHGLITNCDGTQKNMEVFKCYMYHRTTSGVRILFFITSKFSSQRISFN